jgi:DNA-binding PadR family transcriptional regulator
MAQFSRRNPLALAVLTCLYEQPMHPYEISQTLKQRAKEQSIKLNFGSLYNVVESLEKHGLVRELETIQQGRRPPRTIYEITDDGTREMSDWLSELVSIPVKEYLQFEAALSLLGGLPPDDAADLLATRVENLAVRLALLRASLVAAADHGLPRLFALEDEYQLALLEAELDWVRRLVKDIRDGELGGLAEWRSWYEDGAGPPRFELGPGIPT